MSVRRLVLITIVACLVGALVTLVVINYERKPDGPAVDLSKPAYAYTTLTELVVMRGDEVLTKVTRPFDKSDPLNNQVVWSNDGQWVAFLAAVGLLGEDPDEEKLVGIDVRTGQRSEFPCPRCDWIAAVGEDGVLASTGSELRRIALGEPGSGTEVDGPREDGVRIFLAGTRHLALTAEQVSTGRSTGERLKLVSPEGKLHFEVGTFDSNSYMPAAGISGPTTADTLFAVAVRNNPGLCQADFPVHLVNAEGLIADTEWGDAAPPGFVPNEAQGIEVNDLWWDDSRTLHATIVSWTCDDTKQDHVSKKVLHSGSRLWKLDGRRWVLEDDSPATVVRPLGGNGRVVLSIPDCVGEMSVPDRQTYCNLGTVQVVRDGQRTEVATGALQIYAPPATSGEPVRKTGEPQPLRSAPVPELCGHEAGTLQDGKLPGIPEHDGFVQLATSQNGAGDLVASADVTGDGKAETAAVFQCSQGGVAWPENVVVYDDRTAVLGKVDLGSLETSAEKASVERLEAVDGAFQVRWKSYKGAGFCVKTWTARLRVVDGKVDVSGTTQLDGAKDAC
ncbi:hypothetical protein SAMN05216553_1256 [Lentzea fradiae]|uniref:Uncharacterized protein n=1 Tax=Lentzea fradiae TaxID=200378 RepID=A0A1G8CWX2_9PSEU|nr:hypothetical protein [Lentzea fradiae]SDH49996.1 hypothetical protein SAMN05216553_1256 [Lentzea fradiae]